MKKLMLLAPLALVAVFLLAEPVLAAKTAKLPQWRIIWNECWRIANFLILAFLIYKMAKQPLKDFIASQRSNISQELEVMEKAREQAEAELAATKAKTANLAKELEEYEEVLSGLAARKRDESLAQAKAESEMIVERASNQADHALARAKKELAQEMLEEAAQIAAEKLTQAINKEDQEKFLFSFAEQLDQQARQAG